MTMEEDPVMRMLIEGMTNHDFNLHKLSEVIDDVVTLHRNSKDKRERALLCERFEYAARGYNNIVGWKCYSLKMPK